MILICSLYLAISCFVDSVLDYASNNQPSLDQCVTKESFSTEVTMYFKWIRTCVHVYTSYVISGYSGIENLLFFVLYENYLFAEN